MGTTSERSDAFAATPDMPRTGVKIRFLAERQLTSEQRARLDAADEATFLPMEAIGEQGSVDKEATRAIEDVKAGYTRFFDGDVVIAKITPCFENGKGALVQGLLNGVGFGTTELHVVTPKPTLDARYLYYLTAGAHFRRMGEAHMIGAAGQKRVPTDFVLNYRVPVLDMAQQGAIADYLDAETARIDALIAANENLLAILAEKRRAVITQAVTRGLDPNVPMRESGVPWLGEIPAHWEVRRLKFLLDGIEQGWSPQCDNYPAEPEEWGVLKSGCCNGGVFREDENKALPVDIEPLTHLEVRAGDVLMSRASGSVDLLGSCARVQVTVRSKLLFSDLLYRLRVQTPLLNADFLVQVFASDVGRTQIRNAITSTGGLANKLPQSAVADFRILTPPMSEQTEIVDHLTTEIMAIDQMAFATQKTIVLLRERREAVIAAAVTGQLDVGA